MHKNGQAPARKLRVVEPAGEVIGFQVIARGHDALQMAEEQLYPTKVAAEAVVGGRKNLFRIQPVPRFGGEHDRRERAKARPINFG